jgi:hypothetical protein
MTFSLLNSIWRRRTDVESACDLLDEPAVSESHEIPSIDEDEPMRFIARQTIFDRARHVHGYELLFRTGWENCFLGDTEEATRMMIADGALYGFRDLTGEALTFVNCTRDSLVNGLVTLLPTTTVLEIVETVVGDPEVLASCARYKSLGYKLALDDFRMHEDMRGLIELADYIKVDFRLSDAAERREMLSFLKGRNLTLLAEKLRLKRSSRRRWPRDSLFFKDISFVIRRSFQRRDCLRTGSITCICSRLLCKGTFLLPGLPFYCNRRWR